MEAHIPVTTRRPRRLTAWFSRKLIQHPEIWIFALVISFAITPLWWRNPEPAIGLAATAATLAATAATLAAGLAGLGNFLIWRHRLIRGDFETDEKIGGNSR